MQKRQTKVSDTQPATPAPAVGTPLMPDAEGFLTLNCPNCEEAIRFRPARVALNAMLAALPADPPLTHDQKYQAELSEYKRRAEKLSEIFSFFEDGHGLEMFEYLQLIVERDHGCTTPVEDFLTTIIFRYGRADRDGRGLTVEEIESQMETLRENLADAIRDSHFMAARYPKPEASNAE